MENTDRITIIEPLSTKNTFNHSCLKANAFADSQSFEGLMYPK